MSEAICHRLTRYACASLIVLALGALLALPAQAQTYGFRASYEDGGDRVLRTFRIWVPPDVEHLRGAIFLWAGSGQDWRDRAGWPKYQQAARSLGFALVGTRDNELGQSRFEVDRALTSMMHAAADVSGRTELRNAPVVLAGFSQGGFRASKAAALSSGRVIAFVGHKGGQIVELDDEGENVPALFIAAEFDGSFPPDFVRQVFQNWRNEGGLSAYAVDWNIGHTDQGGQGWEAAWYWIAEAIRLRYPEGVLPAKEGDDGVDLLPLALEDGWLADKARFRTDGTPFITNPFFHVAPFADYSGAKDAASWLPSEGAAYMYRAFTSTDREERDQLPFQTPLRFVQPDALDTLTVGEPVTLTLDLRGFADAASASAVQFYDGALDLGGGALGDDGLWHIEHEPEGAGIHAFIAVATDTGGVQRTAFRTVTVLPRPTVASVGEAEAGVEPLASLSNYPNPFSESTTLQFSLGEAAFVEIDVFDTLGRRVARPLAETRPAGTHAVPFDAAGLPSGTYVWRVRTDHTAATRTFFHIRADR